MHLKGAISTGAYTILTNNSAGSVSDYLNFVRNVIYFLSKTIISVKGDYMRNNVSSIFSFEQMQFLDLMGIILCSLCKSLLGMEIKTIKK